MTLNGKYTGEKPKCGRWVIDGETHSTGCSTRYSPDDPLSEHFLRFANNVPNLFLELIPLFSPILLQEKFKCKQEQSSFGSSLPNNSRRAMFQSLAQEEENDLNEYSLDEYADNFSRGMLNDRLLK